MVKRIVKDKRLAKWLFFLYIKSIMKEIEKGKRKYFWREEIKKNGVKGIKK